MHRDIATFARDVLGKPLYPYQLEVIVAILQSIEQGQGQIFTVMMARQAGKNQISAVLEAYLLATHAEGTIIKAAPTFRPQIHTSYERLHRLLHESPLQSRLWSSTSLIGLAPNSGSEREKKQTGARVLFLSANPESNVVGSTAELLLEIDEAQDVECEKFNRDFRPMAAVKNATTVLYGTAWADTTLLAMQRDANLQAQEREGSRLHFEFDWRSVAEHNPAYRIFVEREIARLGEDHPLIQTQYCLHSLSGAGYLLNALQRMLLQGTHDWLEESDEQGEEGWYVAGMDVGGEERTDPHALSSLLPARPGGRHDSSVFTLGRVHYNELQVPCVDVVHQWCWTGKTHMEQYAAVLELLEAWSVRTLVIDATGLGEGLASLLVDRCGAERVRPIHFTQQTKAHLTYQFLGLINSGRLKLPTRSSSPPHTFETCWQQLRLARYRLPAPDLLTMYVDPADGHDDFLISLALLGETLQQLRAPSTPLRPSHPDPPIATKDDFKKARPSRIFCRERRIWAKAARPRSPCTIHGVQNKRDAACFIPEPSGGRAATGYGSAPLSMQKMYHVSSHTFCMERWASRPSSCTFTNSFCMESRPRVPPVFHIIRASVASLSFH